MPFKYIADFAHKTQNNSVRSQYFLLASCQPVMVKAKRQTYSSKQAPYVKKNQEHAGKLQVVPEKPNFQHLLQIKATNEEQYGQPERTQKAYRGYIKNGKTFLTELIAKRQQDDKSEEDRQETDGLGEAFNANRPNKYSAIALELFLTQKCLHEGRGTSTANGIHAAWTSYWDKM